MNDSAPLSDLARLRTALAEREARRAAGRDVPEDAAERVARVLAADEPAPADCAAIAAQMPEFVAAELRGAAVAQLFPDVRRHLLVCAECAALHADLLELELGPEMAPLPAPDLAALRWPAAGEALRRLVAQRARELFARLALSLKDFDELVESFFESVDALGERLTLSPGTSGAFRFSGGEASPEFRLLIATWQATLAVRDAVETRPGITTQGAEFERLLREAARDAARRNGLKGDAGRFIAAFVEVALTPDRDPGGVKDAGSELPG